MTLRGLGTLTGVLARSTLPEGRNGSPALALRWWWLLALLAPLYLILAAVLPPADDEIYYWCWSKTLQFSYYDHPAMTAYMIRVTTGLLGDTLFAIRLPAVIATLTVFAVIGHLTRPRTILPLIAVTPLFTFGAVLVTPDTPLIMFWALYLAWMVKVHENLQDAGQVATGGTGGNKPVSLAMWAVGGVLLGCGILGKYTMGLGLMTGFVAFLFAGHWRRWFAGYVLHVAVAFIVALPILIHNIRHDFVPILYQWKHSMSSPEPGLKPFAEFTGVQLLLFGTTPFWIFVWAIRNRKELLADPRLRVCFCLFVLPFAFFLFKATRGRLEGNWALACYIAVWPLAAMWYETIRSSLFWRRLAVASFLVPLICVLAVGVHLVYPVPLLPPRSDRISRQSAKLEVARSVIASCQELQVADCPIFATDYQWTALLRFAGGNAYQIDGLTRPSHFTLNDAGTPPKMKDFSRVVVLTEGIVPEKFAEGMGKPWLLKQFPLVVNGTEVTSYWLLGYSKPKGGG